jgi:hypothetical protein
MWAKHPCVTARAWVAGEVNLAELHTRSRRKPTTITHNGTYATKRDSASDQAKRLAACPTTGHPQTAITAQ